MPERWEDLLREGAEGRVAKWHELYMWVFHMASEGWSVRSITGHTCSFSDIIFRF